MWGEHLKKHSLRNILETSFINDSSGTARPATALALGSICHLITTSSNAQCEQDISEPNGVARSDTVTQHAVDNPHLQHPSHLGTMLPYLCLSCQQLRRFPQEKRLSLQHSTATHSNTASPPQAVPRNSSQNHTSQYCSTTLLSLLDGQLAYFYQLRQLRTCCKGGLRDLL